jgi:hypothetical protein
MPDMANDPVAWKSDYLRSSGQLSGCVLRHDASRVLVVEGAQRVGLVIDKWGCRSHSSNLPRITGDSHETIAPFAPLHGAGVERTGLNVFAVSGCVLSASYSASIISIFDGTLSLALSKYSARHAYITAPPYFLTARNSCQFDRQAA